MMDEMPNPCVGPLYELAARFVGTWEEYTATDSGETFIGTLVSETDLRGCVFKQRLTLPNGELLFVTFGTVDPEAGIWRETYVFQHGAVRVWHWAAAGDDVIQYYDGGPDDQRRLIVSNMTDDSYETREEYSTDDGETWQFKELTITRRVE